ncbi:S8 family serine peptidase [Nonomuraea sp. NPDC049480]|uniref:S8 family serine peptidase n=1 Tax=Nonomuraea sp. NPDC049480 TaxID=3364353 RepID=UPI0037B13CEC
MTTLDARLRHFLARLDDDVEMTGTLLAERVGWQPGPDLGTVDVLLRRGEGPWPDELLSWAFAPDEDRDVLGARVPVNALERLAALPSIERVESSRPLFPELNVSRPDVRGVAEAPDGSGPLTGAGAIVAIIDSGIDYTHPAFRHANGSSRILYLWDQTADAMAEAAVPYGVEYVKEDIDKALADPRPHRVVPHTDGVSGHGTHVAGIAAGDDSRLGGDYSGLAPRADLIVVALAGTPGVSLGRSRELVDAVHYIVKHADGHPVAINISQGMNGGGHAGESLVERALDAYARRPGVVIVKSAGNEQEWRTHAGGTLAEGDTVELELVVPPGDLEDDIVEIWFDGSDEIGVAVAPPHGPPSGFTRPGQVRDFTTRHGDRVRIDSETDCDAGGDTATTVIITAGGGSGTEAGVTGSGRDGIEAGVWRLILRGDAVRHGRYDAWIERAPRGGPGAAEQSRFAPAGADPTRTISVPGTARRVITVGSYATRPANPFFGQGALSAFSSHGPTRLGARKPDLTAPGEWIASARAAGSAQPPRPDAAHTLMAGTSMAAPHVCGAAALVMAARLAAGLPPLDGEQAGQILRRTARDAGTSPDDGWGEGKLDVTAAVEAARTAVFPRITSLHVEGGGVLAWETDVDCAWELRCHTALGQLTIGKAVAQREQPGFGRTHRADLTGLAGGDYVCEIVVTDRSGLWTRDDNDGHGHLVPVTAAPPAPEVDDFQRIKGVGPKTAQRMNEAGITTFEQFAALSPEQLAAVVQPLGIGAERLAKQDWIAQARLLAAAREQPGGQPAAAFERHSFTVTVIADPRTRRVLSWEARHHQSDDVARKPGWDMGELGAFIAERGDLRLG